MPPSKITLLGKNFVVDSSAWIKQNSKNAFFANCRYQEIAYKQSFLTELRIKVSIQKQLFFE